MSLNDIREPPQRLDAPDGRRCTPQADILLRRLFGVDGFGEAEAGAVSPLLGPEAQHRTGADLGDDGDGDCRVLVSGWACRTLTSPWGVRQILDLVLPGDPIGLNVAPAPTCRYRVIALGRGATADAVKLRNQMRRDASDASWSDLRRACARLERERAARFHDHTMRMGAPSAASGLIHLLLELRRRMAELGELEGARFPMLLSQENLGNAMGVTATQIHRILTQLRREGLMLTGPGWVEIPSPAALANFGCLPGWRD